MAFFWVKLDGENIIPCHCTCKLKRIKTVARYRFKVVGVDIVTMYEIKACIVIDSMPQRMLDSLMDLIPAHMGYLEFLPISVMHCRRGRESPYLSRQDAQTFDITFFAGFKQHL